MGGGRDAGVFPDRSCVLMLLFPFLSPSKERGSREERGMSRDEVGEGERDGERAICAGKTLGLLVTGPPLRLSALFRVGDAGVQGPV